MIDLILFGNYCMKKIGLIGGTSWHSTIEYYRYINQSVNDHFSNNTNPPLLLYTLNQSEIHHYQLNGNWEAIATCILEAANSLKLAGVEALMFCANTPHKVYEKVQKKVNIPILHIADATAKAINERGIDKVCFIGTRFTMEEDFITKRISQMGIEVLVPEDSFVIDELHRIIQKELTYGKVKKESKKFVFRILESMISKGANGIILGCTEFPLIVEETDFNLPIFNTTKIHSRAATDFILGLA